MKNEFNEKCSLWFRKIASLNYALNSYNKYDYIVWVDADCIFTKNIQSNVLIQQFYGTNCFFHLGRKRHIMYGAIESSFIGFKKSQGYKLLKNIINEYSNKQFLKYKRWDDGFIMARIILNSNIKSIDLMPNNISHLEPLLFSFFKDYIYHYKGSHHYEDKKNLNIKNYIEYEKKINNISRDFKVLFITSSTKKMYDKHGKVFLNSFFNPTSASYFETAYGECGKGLSLDLYGLPKVSAPLTPIELTKINLLIFCEIASRPSFNVR